jgi:glycosyltransferase involved in cell wall biosynthesis
MGELLVVDFIGAPDIARTLVKDVMERGDVTVRAPTALLEDLLRRRRISRPSHLIVVGAPPMDGIGYGVVPFLAATLRPRTVTLLDARSRTAKSTSLSRYLGASAPFAVGQLLTSGLAIAAQHALARPQFLRTSQGRFSGRILRNMLYLRPTAGVSVPVGGSVTHAHGMIQGLKELDVTVDAFTNDTAIAKTAAADARFRCTWNVVSAPRATRAVPASAAVGADLALVRASRRAASRCDVVYQRHSRFSLAGALVGRASGLPFFLEFNSPADFFHPRATLLARHLARCEDAVLFSATRIFVVSDAAKELLLARAVPGERVIVNPNGVDFDRFAGSGSEGAVRRRLGFLDDEVIFGFVGSFIAFHGARVLAEAFAELARVSPNARLLLVGDGDEQPRVASILGDLIRERRAVMTGRVPPTDIPLYLAACDVLVSPHVPLRDNTPFFGSPTKVFEYMAAGKAIVASRLGQIADVLDDERTALLVEPGERAALVQALKRLADDPAGRERLGRNAQVEARQYSWTANAQRIIDVFENLPEIDPSNSAPSRG